MISFFRMIKFAFQHFIRNFGLSVITIIIILLTLISANVFIAFNHVTDELITMVQDKIDISLYFRKDVSDTELKHVEDYLSDLTYIKSVEKYDPSQVLANFKASHADNEEMIKSLDEIGENPFGAVLIVKVNSIDDYNYVIQALEGEEFDKLIERRSYDNHEDAISHLKSIGDNVKIAILAFTLIFLLISILIVYNTVKVMIYNHREEIHIMKLVGASDRFVRWPFILEGIIVVTIAMFLNLLLVYPFLLRVIELYFDSFHLNIVSYFTEYFFVIFGLEYLFAILFNMFSSSLAVGKYLKK